jgi:hypothetical protein
MIAIADGAVTYHGPVAALPGASAHGGSQTVADPFESAVAGYLQGAAA